MSRTQLLTNLPHLAQAITPVGAAAGDLVSYVLGYGVLGIVVLALAWILLKGTFVTAKTADERVTQARAEARAADERVAEARAEARAAVVAENARLQAEKDRLQDRLDSSVRLVQDQLFPMLTSFTSATNSLLPVLQQLVARGYITPGGRPGP